MPQITFTDPEAATATELWSDRPEVKRLAEILVPGERVAFVGSGMLGAVSVRQWLIVLTDQRLIALVGTHAITRRVIEIPRAMIRRIRREKGLLKSNVTVKTTQGKVRIHNMSKAAATELFAALSEQLASKESLQSPNPLDWGHAPLGTPAEPTPILPIAPLSRPVVVGHSIQSSAQENRLQRLEALTESLESEVTQLREQVAFLEELLQAKTPGYRVGDEARLPIS
jgi:hypothetical protein